MTRYLLIPFIYSLKTLSICDIINQKGTDRLLVIKWSYRFELFLPKCIPYVKLCPFPITIFDLYCLSLYLHVPRTLFEIIERILNEPICDRCFSSLRISNQYQLIVEVGALTIKLLSGIISSDLAQFPDPGGLLRSSTTLHLVSK